MKSSNPLKLRKGAWASEEDNLLRKCVEKYGEGKWHLVPHRAGLNRCRKSCRLRWLNYLRPNIKRGDFTADEVDLMMRLHKLLGNRWSLIAGRLPGRTANDVKNFWNTNLQRKFTTSQNDMVLHKREESIQIQRKKDSNLKKITAPNTTTTTTVVVKPLPRTLSKGIYLPCYNIIPKNNTNSPSPGEVIIYNNSNNSNNNNNNTSPNTTTTAAATTTTNNNSNNLSTSPPPDLDSIEWWKNLLAEIEIPNHEEDSSEGLLMLSSENMDVEQDLCLMKIGESSAPASEANGLLADDRSGWSDIWELLNSDS